MSCNDKTSSSDIIGVISQYRWQYIYPVLYIYMFICFCTFSHLLSLQISIPVTSVAFIKKTRTAILVPNALIIATTQERVGLILHDYSFNVFSIFYQMLNYFTVCICVIPVTGHHLQSFDVCMLPVRCKYYTMSSQ